LCLCGFVAESFLFAKGFLVCIIGFMSEMYTIRPPDVRRVNSLCKAVLGLSTLLLRRLAQ